MLQLAADHGEVLVVRDQVGSPTYTWHLAAGLVRLIEGSSWGIHHMAGAESLLLVRLRARDLRPGEGRVQRALRDHRHARPPGAQRPACSALGTQREARSCCPHWRDGPRRLPGPAPGRARGGDGMKLLVAGGAGFIGSNYVRRRLDDAPRRLGAGARQAHLRGAAREPRGPRAGRARRRRHLRPRRRPRRARRLRRDRQLRRRVARRPLDPLARASSSRPTSSAPSSCSRRPATPASAICRSPPTRSTARSTRARSPRPRRSTHPRPTRPRRRAAT